MKLRLLVAACVGMLAGVLIAVDAARVPGYVASYSAFGALLIAVVVALAAIALLVPKRTRSAGGAVLLAGFAFYAAFLVSMNLLERRGVWADRMVPIGPPTKADLIVLFKAGVDQRRVNEFVETVLSTPDANGGHAHRPGVLSIMLIRVPDHDGYSIRFSLSATPEQRADVRARATASPIVEKVFENVRVDQIKL